MENIIKNEKNAQMLMQLLSVAVWLITGLSFMLFSLSIKKADNGWITILLFFITIILGAAAYFLGKIKAIDNDEELEELKFLKFIYQNRGKVTIAATALHFEISTEKAKEKLDDMHQKGIVEVDVTPNGTLVYQLSSFLGEKESQ